MGLNLHRQAVWIYAFPEDIIWENKYKKQLNNTIDNQFNTVPTKDKTKTKFKTSNLYQNLICKMKKRGKNILVISINKQKNKKKNK